MKSVAVWSEEKIDQDRTQSVSELNSCNTAQYNLETIVRRPSYHKTSFKHHYIGPRCRELRSFFRRVALRDWLPIHRVKGAQLETLQVFGLHKHGHHHTALPDVSSTNEGMSSKIQILGQVQLNVNMTCLGHTALEAFLDKILEHGRSMQFAWSNAYHGKCLRWGLQNMKIQAVAFQVELKVAMAEPFQ